MARAPRLLVATSAGVLYVYALDSAEGGECALLRQHVFVEPVQAAPAHQPQTEGNPSPSRARSEQQSPRSMRRGAAAASSGASRRATALHSIGPAPLP